MNNKGKDSLLQVKDGLENESCKHEKSPFAGPTGHHFWAHNFRGPTYCDQCSDFIFGPNNQGLKCTVCNMATHFQCENMVTAACPFQRQFVRVAKEVNFNDGEISYETFQASNLGRGIWVPQQVSPAPKEKEPPAEVAATEPTPLVLPERKTNHKHRVKFRKRVEKDGHTWQDTYFYSPTFCDHCTEFIWGVHKYQGYQCKHCKLKIHRQCCKTIESCTAHDREQIHVSSPSISSESSLQLQAIQETEFSKKYFCGDKRPLGRGAFGVVLPCVCKATNVEYAVKMIDTRRFRMNPKHLEILNREIKLMTSVKHSGIVQAVDFFNENNRFEIVMELCGKDLSAYMLSKPDNYLEEAEAKYLFWQILVSIQYLHHMRITHRDLKPENVLLKTVTGTQYPLQTKLADFGLAKSLDESEYTETFAGTPLYMAPEIGAKKPGSRPYTKIVDMWSLGGILYAMLCGQPPFRDDPERTQLKFTEPRWEEVSDDAKDLISHLLVKDPDRRFDADTTTTHLWLQDPDLQYYFPTLPLRDLDSLVGLDSVGLDPLAGLDPLNVLTPLEEEDEIPDIIINQAV